MQTNLSIVLIQDDFTVGAVEKNLKKVTAYAQQYTTHDILVFPELVLTGYPPEDLLLHPHLQEQVDSALQTLLTLVSAPTLIIGHPRFDTIQQQRFNTVSVIHQGKVIAQADKQELPNYGVFDEYRYFVPGKKTITFSIQQTTIALLICEDIWVADPCQQLVNTPIDLAIIVNASPYARKKFSQRQQLVAQHVQALNCPMLYLNHVGGQDELIFDGRSFAMNADQQIICQLTAFSPDQAQLYLQQGKLVSDHNQPAPLNELAEIYAALVLATQDYVQKNGFTQVLLGLSGGIDSALTLAIAVDALGADKIHAVMMPYHHTAQISIDDAATQCQQLQIKHSVIPIHSSVNAIHQSIEAHIQDPRIGQTIENLQARVRGNILMSLSNQSGALVLTTSNKSESAVGYCTLYGDMCGGFSVIKDVPKTLVYALANYRNTLAQVIPQRIIDRPPSAELAPNQTDQDSLPDYTILDEILMRYIEQSQSAKQIIAAGFDSTIVLSIIRLIQRNEYKRRQSAIGPKITARNFDRERRYPITNQFNENTHEKN